MSFIKEEKIQEAIRLVQECNYSRRKAASSTGISPNTLKRRLNGSIPREEYLEKTKKITASEELILENMIISLIQQGEHIKASTLRLLVAIYIRNKTIPTNFNTQDIELESIPKGWCSRFMKRSKNLIVNQGAVEIANENSVESPSDPPSAFSMLLSPPKSDSEDLAETQEHIADSATVLIENFRISFETLKKSCNTNCDSAFLLDTIESMSTLFKDVSTLATVLNFTSHIAKSRNSPIQYARKRSSNNNNNNSSEFRKFSSRRNSDEKPDEANNTNADSDFSRNKGASSDFSISGSKKAIAPSEKTSDVSEFITAGLETPTSPVSPQSDPSLISMVSKKRSFRELNSDGQGKNYSVSESQFQDWSSFSANTLSNQSFTDESVELLPTEIEFDESSSIPGTSTQIAPGALKRRPSGIVNCESNFYSYSYPDSCNPSTYCPEQQLYNVAPPIFLTNSDINVLSSISMPTTNDLEYSNMKNSDYINLSSSSDDVAATGNTNKADPNNLESVNVDSILNLPNNTIAIP